MKALNQTKNMVLASNAVLADSFCSRMKGLLGKSSLQAGEGLWITHCNSIHMFFMKFAIDVVFIDKDNKAVGLVENIRPFRLSSIFWRAQNALELPAGVIQKTQTEIGDCILMES